MVSMNSCDDETIKLRPSDIMTIDTLYKTQSKQLEIELDSICDAQFQQRFEKALDSIMDLRLEERKKRLGF